MNATKRKIHKWSHERRLGRSWLKLKPTISECPWVIGTHQPSWATCSTTLSFFPIQKVHQVSLTAGPHPHMPWLGVAGIGLRVPLGTTVDGEEHTHSARAQGHRGIIRNNHSNIPGLRCLAGVSDTSHPQSCFRAVPRGPPSHDSGAPIWRGLANFGVQWASYGASSFLDYNFQNDMKQRSSK